MKIIFLDIDGVLNSQLWAEQQIEMLKDKPNPKHDTKDEWKSSMIDPRCVELLNHLIARTRAKVVLTSSWRGGNTKIEMTSLLQKQGFKYDILDYTPELGFLRALDLTEKMAKAIKYSYSVPRGCEIKAWLELNKGILGNKMTKVKYIILDDDSDMLYWQRNEYFRVDGYTGLTPNLIYRAVRFLNSED